MCVGVYVVVVVLMMRWLVLVCIMLSLFVAVLLLVLLLLVVILVFSLIVAGVDCVTGDVAVVISVYGDDGVDVVHSIGSVVVGGDCV